MIASRYVFRTLLATLFLGVAITPLMAQNAQIAGLVTDPSGAVIPGATITITNIDTGVAIKTVSNGQGSTPLRNCNRALSAKCCDGGIQRSRPRRHCVASR